MEIPEIGRNIKISGEHTDTHFGYIIHEGHEFKLKIIVRNGTRIDNP